MSQRQIRKIKDGFLNLLTYISSGLAILVLVAIFAFVFIRGFNTLSWDMLTDDYWSLNYKLSLENNEAGNFERPENLSENIHFSSQYGIGLSDFVNRTKNQQVIVSYIHPDSPFNDAYSTTSGESFNQPVDIQLETVIQNMTISNEDGSTSIIGTQRKQDAQTVTSLLDDSVAVNSMFIQTQGGGIYGSIIATLMLIGVSLLISVPMGIGAAIYLHEYAKDNLVTRLMRSSIEMLSGVPSIIFGLMGVAVLFPITSILGANSTSILLGALTLSVMLLPIVIRQTEESLIVVPDGLRSASLSLGATKTQTIFKVILPAALPGILSAILLAISRVIGESAALIYTMGTTIVDNPQVLQGATSLAVQIWQIMSGEQPNFELASAISIVILVMVLSLNIIVKVISNRLNRKWSA